jgi:hypothetical protein
MEFTLYYHGPLKAASASNRRPRDKHKLRKHFHKQLKELWKQKPLVDHPEFLQPVNETATHMGRDEDDDIYVNMEDITLLREVGDFQFVPAVSEKLEMVADLTITLLRPGPLGGIVTARADLDNQLKTLLDALKAPRESAELPPGVSPELDEAPFFCLVEDDALITSINITTDRLLKPTTEKSEVLLLIHVRTRLVKGNMANLGLV